MTYTITTTVTNGTYTGDTSITADGTATITITANDGYTLPDDVTVTGATGTWNKTTGTLSISNPIGKVFVTAECVEEQTGETWVLNTTVSAPSATIDEIIDFLCVNTAQDFIRILIESEAKGVHLEYFAVDDSSTAGTSVLTGGTAPDAQYRRLTFSTPPLGNLLTWLQANGVKQ